MLDFDNVMFKLKIEVEKIEKFNRPEKLFRLAKMCIENTVVEKGLFDE